MSTIGEFYLARLAEAESGWLAQKRREDDGDAEMLFHFGQRLVDELLADIAVKRRIVELHEQWPILVERPPELVLSDPSDLGTMTFKMTQQIRWATEQEYRKVFTVKATEGAKRSGVVHEVLWRNACPWCRHPAHGAVDSGEGPLCAVGLPDGSDCACPNWGPSDTERAGVQSGVSDGLRDSTNRQVSGNVWED